MEPVFWYTTFNSQGPIRLKKDIELYLIQYSSHNIPVAIRSHTRPFSKIQYCFNAELTITVLFRLVNNFQYNVDIGIMM